MPKGHSLLQFSNGELFMFYLESILEGYILLFFIFLSIQKLNKPRCHIILVTQENY